MKYVKLEFATENWLIPLEFIAKHRADYYKQKDGDEADYQGEIDFVMNDTYEGIDWIKNNMDYKDFENEIIVEDFKNSVDVDWCNAESSIIEK